MKVFISTDLEGVSGIVSWQQTGPEGGEHYTTARRLLTMDVNAAIEGAVAAGATEILVDDCHGAFLNIVYEELHPAADIVRGSDDGHRPRYLMEGLDPSFDLALLIGYHAQSQDWPGILSHTYSSRHIKSVRFNDVVVSEARMAAALAGAIGVPVGMVSGDNRICGEVASWLPGVEAAVVKYALDRHTARCVSHQRALERIRSAALVAVQRARDFKPITFEPPVRLEVSLFDPSLVYRAASVPGAERVQNDTVAFEAPDYLEAHEAFLAILYVISYSPG
jgi:D-amino peptidase